MTKFAAGKFLFYTWKKAQLGPTPANPPVFTKPYLQPSPPPSSG